jgi:hypothetical protein
MSEPKSIPSQINSADTYKFGSLNVTGLLKAGENYKIDGVPVASLSSPISFDSPIRCSTFEAELNTVSFFERAARRDWRPSNMGGLFGWYDASDSSTITHDANTVSAWADKSGKGYDLTVEQTAPATNSASLGGLNVISFDGSGNLVNSSIVPPTESAADWDGYGNNGDNNLMIFIVSELTSWGGNDAIFSLASNESASKGFSIEAGGSAAKFKAKISGLGATTPADENRNGPSIYCLSHTTASRTLYVDGDEKESKVQSEKINKGLATAMLLRIFERKLADDKEPEGTCAEVILCNEVDEAARQATEGYLAHKWGLEGNLPSNHPYKASSPKV